MTQTVGLDAFAERLRAVGDAALMPPHLAPSVRFPEPPELCDVLRLGDRAAVAVLRSEEQVITVPLVVGSKHVRRATAGDGVFAELLRAIGRADRVGRFEARLIGSVVAASTERAIDVERSNDSVLVGDAVIVKVYPRTSPGPQPALDVPAHLAEVGFAETPDLVGTLEWTDEADRRVVLATATAWLPGAREGWAWHRLLVEAVADGREAPRVWADRAAAMGGVVGRFHMALATASTVVPSPRSLADAPVIGSWAHLADQTLADALELTTGPEGDRLRELEPTIRRSLRAFTDVGSTPITPIHGDLHVGQVIPWEGGFAVIDFEGNPLQVNDERGALRSPARDVASMVRSLDHVGRLVQRRRPERTGDIDGWVAEARRSFLRAYRRELEGNGVADLFDERLLHPFEVAQECHEYVYAARFLPGWVSVPDLALPRLLGGA